MAKRILSLAIAAILALSCMIPAFACKPAESDKTLRFNGDGTFKIMQVADWQDRADVSLVKRRCLEDTLKAEKPDLVVLTGDNIRAYVVRENKQEGMTHDEIKAQIERAIDNYMRIFEFYKVPVAVVFGNHDDEGNISKEEQMKIYQSYDCCVAIDEGEEIYGCGTYNLPILSSSSDNVKFNLWCFDSNSYDTVNGGYDYVHDDQVDWYINKSAELQAANGGEPVPSIAFQHIVPKEIFKALEDKNNLIEGEINEEPCPATVQGRQVEAMLSRGDVKAIVFGHEHENTFIVNYEGIKLINSPTSGFGSYGSSATRGVRVITLNENNPDKLETRLINYAKDLDKSYDLIIELSSLDFDEFIGEPEYWLDSLELLAVSVREKRVLRNFIYYINNAIT